MSRDTSVRDKGWPRRVLWGAALLFACVPMAATCEAGRRFDLARASEHYRNLPAVAGIAPGFGTLATTEDDRENHFTVLSWNDDELDSRVFGFHAASLHAYEHRRRVWGDVAMQLAVAPALWRSEGGRQAALAWLDRLRAGTGVEARELVELAGLIERSAEVVRQMNLGYLPEADFGAGLANSVKQLLSARPGGGGGRDAVAGWLGRNAALFRTLEAVGLFATLADQAVAAGVLNALATDEAVRRAETLAEVARADRDPAFRAGAEDALAAIEAVQASNWYEYVQALSDHLPELVGSASAGGAAALQQALGRTPWWRSVASKGPGPQLLAITASIEAVVSLVDQNLTLQRAALLGVAEAAVRADFDRRRGAPLGDDREVLALADRETMLGQAQVSYFETLLVATGPQGWLDLLGKLIRWLSPGQRELRAQLEAERDAATAGLQNVLRAQRAWTCAEPGWPESACAPVVAALARGERVAIRSAEGEEMLLGEIPHRPFEDSVEVEALDWVEGFTPGRRLLRLELMARMGASGWSKSAWLLECGRDGSLSELWSGIALSIVEERLLHTTTQWAADDGHCCPSLASTRALSYSEGRVVESEPFPSRDAPEREAAELRRHASALAGTWEALWRDERWVLRLYPDGSFADARLDGSRGPDPWTTGLWKVEPSGIQGIRNLVLYDATKPWNRDYHELWRLKSGESGIEIYMVLDGPESPDSLIELRRVGSPPGLTELSEPHPGLRFRPVDRGKAAEVLLPSPSKGRLDAAGGPAAQAESSSAARASRSASLGSVVRRQGSLLTCTLTPGSRLEAGVSVVLSRAGARTGRAMVVGDAGGELELELIEELGTGGPLPGDEVGLDE